MTIPEPMQGDVLVSAQDNTWREVVLGSTTEWKSRMASCACCSEEHSQTFVWVPGLEPVEVILSGGGTTHVWPTEKREWPPEGDFVYRDGKQIWPDPTKNRHGVVSDPHNRT